MAIALLQAAKMHELDRLTIDEIGIPGPVLMEVAGRACAEAVEELLPADRPGSVAVVCGKGNNGGDGYVAARHLIHSGHRVDVFLLGDADKLSSDAALNHAILERLGISVLAVPDTESLVRLELGRYDVILDAIFGTGLTSDVRGHYAKAIERINASGVPVVAVDIPSGISSDTGGIMGVAVRAVQTVTFAYPKPGQVIYPGAKHAGDITVVDIGIPPGLAPDGPGSTWLLTDEDIARHLARREADDHKGRFGHLVVVAGSLDKPGAAGLCCRAAVRSGAGLVTLAADPAVLARVVAGAVEFMGSAVTEFEALAALCKDKQAVAMGPGLGTSKEAADFARRAVAELNLPMVVDADGLNNLTGNLQLRDKADAPRILTPHPGEMARLLQTTTAEIQRDRLGCARFLATGHDCIVVLKGAGTVVADGQGTAFVVPTGNPGMASGGTGDVLTGIIASLLAQGLPALDSACVGAYVHGQAGDRVSIRKGQRALAATDMIDALGEVLQRFESWQDEDED